MPLQIPVTQTGLEASIQQAMKNAGRNAQINLGVNSRQINALAQPLGRITGQADEFTKSMEAANARVFAFGASVGIINGVSKAFGALVKNTIEVEKSLVEINTVLNTSGDSLQKFGNKLFDVAKTTGQTFDVVAKGALELARQGLSTEETLKRINDALILSRLSGLDAQQSVEGLTAAFNSFKETGITTSQILNKLVVVSQKYSVSERDLIEGLKRSASVADQAGVSFDELVGIITTVQERTARGGAVIGNAFKTIFARIQDTGALQDLSNLGIQVTDLQGKVLPATKILQNLGAEFNNLSQLEQADIAKKLGGVYQLSNLLAAVKDLSSEQSKYNDIVRLSAGATNEAYQKNATLNETLASLINKVNVSAQQLGATLGAIGITNSLKGLLDFFNNILEGIQKILGEESMLGDMFRGLAKGIGNVLAGPGLALFGAIIAKLSKDLISFGVESLKSFFKIGQSAKEIASVEKAIAAALGSNLTLQRQLFALEGNRAAQIKLMTEAIVQQEAVMRRMASTAGSLAGPLYQQGVRSTGGQGLRVPKAAGGYMPAVSQESRDINRGVGGAKAGDKPVVIPNFAFGGGKKGTMVAHTGEYIVPNFAAGGSAIFNRDMVRSMGLPAGAQKIGAAGGFIPNFAKLKELPQQGYRDFNWSSFEEASKAAKDGFVTYNNAQYRISKSQFDRALVVTNKQKKVIDVASVLGDSLPTILTPSGSSGLSESIKKINPLNNGLDYNFQFKKFGLQANGKQSIKQDFERRFNDETIKNLANKTALSYARKIVSSLDSKNPIEPETLEKVDQVKGFISSVKGAFGGIFDAAVTTGVRAASRDNERKAITKGIGDFDVNARGESLENIKKLFGENSVSKNGLADFKINAGKEAVDSMTKKVLSSTIFTNRLKNIGVAEAINKASNQVAVNKAEGFIPNFADPLKEAIDREMSAGVPASQIYVDKNSSLKNPMNPMGLMVANRRDEPAGGMQGINRARKEGANPMLYGASGGFVPNYANSGPGTMAGGTGSYTPTSPSTPGTSTTTTDLEKPKRDFLGTIFLVQTGMSLLTGATSDATSTMGKLSNAVGSVVSAASTAALVGQGLSGLAKEGSIASKVLGKIGIYGAVAAGAFELYKQVGSYFDSTNASINKARGSMEKVADAASKAAVNLSTLKPSQQEKIRQSREALVSGARSFKTGRTNIFGEEGKGYIDFEGVSDVLEESFNQTIDQALAVGVSYTTMWNMIQEASKSGSKITADEVNKISQEIEGLIEIAAKFKPEDFIKNFNLKPEEGFGQKLINAKPKQIESFLQGSSGTAKQFREFFSASGINNPIAQVESLKNVAKLLDEQANAQTSAAEAAKEGISAQIKETLKLLKVQQLIDKRKTGEEIISKTSELANQERMLAISSDLSMSETQRAKALVLLENAYTNLNKEIETGSKISDELDKAMADISTKSTGLFQGDKVATAVGKAKNAIVNFGSAVGDAKLISDAIAESGTGSTAAYEALAKTVGERLGAGFKENASYVNLVTDNLIKTKTEQTKINSGAEREKYFREKNVQLALKQKQIEQDRKSIVEKVNYNLEGRASALSYQAGQISNQKSINEAKKGFETAIYEKTATTTSPQDYQKGLDEINQKYFDLEQDAALKKAELEAKADLIRNNKVDENSVKLGENTTALADFKTLLDNDIKRLLQNMPSEIKKAIEEANPQLAGGVVGGAGGTAIGGTAANNIVGKTGVTQDLINYVKNKETFQKMAYDDHKQRSIGYGTKAKDGEYIISEPVAYQRLLEELESHSKRVEDAAKKAGVVLNQNQKDALTSFDYNTGLGAKYIKEYGQNFETLTSKMLEIVKASNKVQGGLVTRRKEEVEMFNKPINVSTSQSNINSNYGAVNPNAVGGMRNQALTTSAQGTKLLNLLNSVSQQLGVQYQITSALQKPGTGEGYRHDTTVGAADIQLIKNGKVLNFTNPGDQAIMQEFVKNAVAGGATGVGAGLGYMGPNTMHIGYGTPAVWGGKTGSGLKPPSWIIDAFNQGRGNASLPVNQVTQQLTSQQFGLSEDQWSKAKEISSKDASEISDAAFEAAQSFGKSREETDKIAENIKNAAFSWKTSVDLSKIERQTNQINKDTERFNRGPRSFGSAFSDSIRNLKTESDKVYEQFGTTIPNAFADGLSQAIQDAVSGAKDLEDALLSAASSFLNEIQSIAIKNLAQSFTSSLGGGLESLTKSLFNSGGNSGGSVPKYASGGMINGGSGSKDDVPAMLMGGEYVVNKKAVQKYGPDFLHAINSGTLGGYAKGGQVKDFYAPSYENRNAIKGKSDLLSFASQAYTMGTGPEGVNLTNFARRNTAGIYGLTRSAKEQALGLYIQQNEQEKAAVEAEKARKKALRKQITTSIITSVAGAGLTAGLNAAATGFSGGWEAAGGIGKDAGGISNFGNAFSSGLKGSWSGVKTGDGATIGGLSNYFSGIGNIATGNFKQGASQIKLSQFKTAEDLQKAFLESQQNKGYFSNYLTSTGYSPNLNIGPNGMIRRATGGIIPQTSGVDTVPSMLTGGEFIMNRSATQNIGVDKLQSLNSGSQNVQINEQANNQNNEVVNKLDELIKTIQESSGEQTGNITINVDSGGKSTETTDGSSKNSDQELARKIKDIVVKQIQQEKRIGGQLRGGK